MVVVVYRSFSATTHSRKTTNYDLLIGIGRSAVRDPAVFDIDF